MRAARGLVAFDLDGTLLRGPTVCELLAAPLGRGEEMARFEALRGETEIAAARAEMVRWYEGCSAAQLRTALDAATWAPGAREGVALLRARGVEVAIASITWSFAVDWAGERLGVVHTLGTRLAPDGGIEHVWPRDKAAWLAALRARLGVPPERTAAVGDTASDGALLGAATLRFFVGEGAPPPLAGIAHRPGADLELLAREVLAAWRD